MPGQKQTADYAPDGNHGPGHFSAEELRERVVQGLFPASVVDGPENLGFMSAGESHGQRDCIVGSCIGVDQEEAFHGR